MASISTTSNLPNHPTPRSKITIRQVPFNSLLAFNLVQTLDLEQSNDEPGPDPVPRPDADGQWPAFDVRTDPVHVSDTLDPVRNEDIYFFIAFAVPQETENIPDTQISDQTWLPAGCIAFRLMPYFPSHRALPEVPRNNAPTPATTTTDPEPKTAELKRFYVLPGYRYSKDGEATRRILTFDDHNKYADPTVMSVATALIHTAEQVARDRLQVQRMVLETWAPLLPAIKFYQRVGYTRRADYGDWVVQGEAVGGHSRCFEKMLV